MAQSWSRIHRLAAIEAMRAHYELDIDVTKQIDPFLALRRSGVIVMRQHLDRLSGVYLPPDSTEFGRAGVLVNVVHPLSRQRYTAAHELWHHRRDREIVLDVETERLARGTSGMPERERLAEAFASWFLMPMQLVSSTMTMLGLVLETLDASSVYRLSLEFGTSYTSTVRHLHGLKMIDTNLLERLIKITPQSIKRSLGNMDLAADPWKDVRLVEPLVDARTIGALEGDVVVVVVPENPSTGYLWTPTVIPDIVSLERDEYHPSSANELGGGGHHHFVFSVIGAGEQRFRLELFRPWISNETVEVRELGFSSESVPTSGMVNPFDLVSVA